MHEGRRYRLDRYYQIDSAALTNRFCQYLRKIFVDSGLAPLLNEHDLPSPVQQKQNILALKVLLKKINLPTVLSEQQYTFKCNYQPYNNYAINWLWTTKKNHLNKVIRQTIKKS